MKILTAISVAAVLGTLVVSGSAQAGLFDAVTSGVNKASDTADKVDTAKSAATDPAGTAAKAGMKSTGTYSTFTEGRSTVNTAKGVGQAVAPANGNTTNAPTATTAAPAGTATSTAPRVPASVPASGN